MTLRGYPVVVDVRLPTHRELPDGTLVPVFAWVIDGRIHIRPDRLEQLEKALEGLRC